LTKEDRANAAPRNNWVSGSIGGTEQAAEPGDEVEAPEDGDGEGYDQSDSDAPDDADGSHPYAVAAEQAHSARSADAGRASPRTRSP
jgi:hypothetical protein